MAFGPGNSQVSLNSRTFLSNLKRAFHLSWKNSEHVNFLIINDANLFFILHLLFCYPRMAPFDVRSSDGLVPVSDPSLPISNHFPTLSDHTSNKELVSSVFTASIRLIRINSNLVTVAVDKLSHLQILSLHDSSLYL